MCVCVATVFFTDGAWVGTDWAHKHTHTEEQYLDVDEQIRGQKKKEEA